MTRNDDANLDAGSEADLERLLRAAGKRDQPPDDFIREARGALHSEWSAMVAERRSRRRRWAAFAVAASMAVVAVGGWLMRENAFGSARSVAEVDRVVGSVVAEGGWFIPARSVARNQQLDAGDEVRTGRASGVAFELSSGIVVRLDADTRVALVDARHLRIRSGAAYVDASARGMAPAPMLIVETPFGEVRHLGTQYEVRVAEQDLRITVREGRVELTGLDGIARTGEPGERLTLSADGRLERTPVARDASEWQWANALAVPFAIESRPLSEFLAWAARELGREVRYATAESEAEAESTILRGSVSDLAPQEALVAVLATTRLRGEIRGDHIAVSVEER